MGIARATEALNSPVAHEALAQPQQPLIALASLAGLHRSFLAPDHAIKRILRPYRRIIAHLGAAGQADQLQLVEHRASAAVVGNGRAKVPSVDLPPMAGNLIREIAEAGSLRVADNPSIVAVDEVAGAVLAVADDAGGQREPYRTTQQLRCIGVIDQGLIWQMDVQPLMTIRDAGFQQRL